MDVYAGTGKTSALQMLAGSSTQCSLPRFQAKDLHDAQVFLSK